MTEKTLPHTWSMASLCDLGEWRGGGTPSKLVKDYWNGNIPWVSPKDMKQDSIVDSADHITKNAVDDSATKLIPPDSILCVTRSGILAHTFPVALTTVPVTVNQDIKALTPFKGIDARYLASVIRARGRTILDTCSKDGTTVDSIESSRLYAYRVPVAPEREQPRIVAKIEELFSELDKALDSLTTVRTQLSIYRQALLKHAFEGKLTAGWREKNKDKLESPNKLLARIHAERDASYQQLLRDWQESIKDWQSTGKPDTKPSKPRRLDAVPVDDISLPTLPEGWVWARLGNLNTDVFDGPFGSNLKTSDYVNDGVRVIRLENIGYLKFIEDKCSYVTEDKYERLKKHTVRAGDIIFSSFVIDGIRLAILPDTIDRAVNKADCFCVRLHGEAVRTDYAASFLSTRTAYKQIESEIHGIGRPRINTTQLKNFAIPLCGRAEQNEIMSQLSEKLSLTDNIDVSIEREIEKCNMLRQSILENAFSGKLVPQDPNDEPASLLLNRISREKTEKDNGKKKIRRKDAA